MMIFPTEWKVIKFMFQTTNQSTMILEPDLPYFSASFWGTKDVCQKSSPYENPRNWAKFSVSQQRSPRVLQPSGHLGKEPGKVHSLLWKMDENSPWRYDFPTEKMVLMKFNGYVLVPEGFSPSHMAVKTLVQPPFIAPGFTDVRPKYWDVRS